jgi:UDP-N-acetylmuramate dehydrogenase
MSMPHALLATFGSDRVTRDRPLAPLTTFQIGGPADWYLEAATPDEVVAAVVAAREDGVSLVVLGGGSNVLIGDGGIRGLVLRSRATAIVHAGVGHVRADVGASLGAVVRWTVREGLGGLEAWAGTPGTVGGAVAGNAHFAGSTIGERVAEVGVVDPEGRVRVLPPDEMAFGYDVSRLKTTGELALWVTFAVTPGQDPGVLGRTARASLAHRKASQPLRVPSAGCVFQNPVRERDVVPDGVPWSAGALVDRAGLKGYKMGGARVSPVHANFIVNEGGATAADVRALMELCRREVASRFGVVLRDEIVVLGEFSVPGADSRKLEAQACCCCEGNRVDTDD